MAVVGLAQLFQTVELVRERLNPNLTIAGILPCRVDLRTRHSHHVIENLRAQFGDLVCKTAIRENVRLAESPSAGKPVLSFDPRSTGARDYRALAEELICQEAGR
jgi:chromosome partitioning protein